MPTRDRNLDYEAIFAQEKLIFDLTEELCRYMEENGVTRSELAERMGRTRGFVSQILNGGRNFTLRTLADVIRALGPELTIQLNPASTPNRSRSSEWRYDDSVVIDRRDKSFWRKPDQEFPEGNGNEVKTIAS